MSLDVFKACTQGYADRMFDQQILGVCSGYWAGYYGRGKNPKSVKSVVEKMIRKRNKSSEHSEEVDVVAFQAMEERFKQKLNQ